MLNARAVSSVSTLVLALSSVALGGCSKVQSMLGKGDAGTESASGGGLFGLKKDDGLAFLSGFEGEIDVMAKGKASAHHGAANAPAQQETMNLSLFVKDKKFRLDIPPTAAPGGQPFKGYGVLDAPQKKAFLVTDTPEKMAIVFDLNKTGEQLKSFSPGERAKSFGGQPAKPSPPPKVTKTGRKDKVAGYECEDWDIESTDPASTDGKASICVAQQGFSWLQIPLLGAPAEYAWMGELLDGSHIPLRFVGYEKDGKESARVEVTKIEKKTLAANLFEIPAGYPQMSLDQMMQKMMGGFGAPGAHAGAGGAPPPGSLPPGFDPSKLPPGVHIPQRPQHH